MDKIKIGFDVHGVLDRHFDKYKQFIDALDRSKFEVHIVTGVKEHIGLEEDPRLATIEYDAWFSIHQHCEDKPGVHVAYDSKNRPLVAHEHWDRAKAEYCKEAGLFMLIDDSPVYGDFFSREGCLYLQQTNNKNERVDWRKHGK